MNLTGTMIWADFWSATEPNLAIVCVSLPMLGSLWSRCTSRRGASKLDHYHSSENGTNASAFSKLKARSHAGNQVALESLYAANQEVHYQTAVATAATPEPLDEHRVRERTAHTDKDSGSEVLLTMDTGSDGFNKQDGIRVQTKWTISHD